MNYLAVDSSKNSKTFTELTDWICDELAYMETKISKDESELASLKLKLDKAYAKGYRDCKAAMKSEIDALHQQVTDLQNDISENDKVYGEITTDYLLCDAQLSKYKEALKVLQSLDILKDFE